MAFIDGAVVNMVLPILQSHLNASITQAQWIIEIYALFLAALIMVGGALGDIHGHRKIFAMGISGFCFSSLLCGLSQNVEVLIFARAFQGIGGALMVPGSLAIISANFSEKQRGAAIGTWSAATALTMAVGPVAGAWLADSFSWRWIFFLNIPIGLLVIIILFWRVPETTRANCKPLDKTGAASTTLGLALLTFGLIESGRYGIQHPLILTAITGGIVISGFFLWHQKHSNHPMMPLDLFRSTNFSGANIMTLLLYAALGGAFFFIPYNLVNIQGYTVTQAAGSYLPFIMVMTVFSRFAGSFADKYGARLPMTLGPIITAIGYFLFSVPDDDINYWTQFFPAILIQGIGMTMTVAPLTATVMNSVSKNNLGIASSVNNMVSRTAGLLAIAVFGIVFIYTGESSYANIISNETLSSEMIERFIDKKNLLAKPAVNANIDTVTAAAIIDIYHKLFISAYRMIMYIACILAFLSGVISWMTIKDNSHQK
jgi:EmrB/QacA subfamily drug resistance transporter